MLTAGWSLARDSFSSSPLHPFQLSDIYPGNFIFQNSHPHSASCRQTEYYQSVTRSSYFRIFVVPELQECNVEISFICAQVMSPGISFCKYTSSHLLHVEEDMSKKLAAKNVSVISMGLCKRHQICIQLFFQLRSSSLRDSDTLH